jgi:hypothetical protein
MLLLSNVLSRSTWRLMVACTIVGGAIAACMPASAGVVVPTTEHFATDAANWHDNSGTAEVSWVASGGPDGSSYVSTAFNFVDLPPGVPIPGNAVALFRAQDEFNSSDNAFVGDWVSSGVSEFSFYVRHSASMPLNFFARFATPANAPAWSGVEFAPVAPNTWTLITIAISLSNPGLFFEGPPGAGQAEFNAVFGNLGHVQIGAFAAGLAGVDQTVTFDLDQPTITPAPGAVGLLGLALLTRRRRR